MYLMGVMVDDDEAEEEEELVVVEAMVEIVKDKWQ